MTQLTRRSALAAAAAMPMLLAAPALAADDHDRQMREDWPFLARYANANAALKASNAPVDIVFMGDSITEGWVGKDPAFFSPGRVGRGIGGQTTPQMLLRMMADVIALKPRAVHIMAGTNDIAGNTGPMTAAMSCDNIRAMATLARANGIKVILASIPPAASFPWRPQTDTLTPIRLLNQWIRDYAKTNKAAWVDYHSVLADQQGGMQSGMAYDGVHPTEAGYARMETVLEPLLRRL